MRDMQVGEDADLARLDHMLAEAREIAGAGAAGVDRRGDAGGAAKFFRVDAERRAAPIDVGVEIDQPRRDDVAGHVAHIGAGVRLQIVADLRDLAGGEGDVRHRVELLGRVDHPSAAQDQIDGHEGLRMKRRIVGWVERQRNPSGRVPRWWVSLALNPPYEAQLAPYSLLSMFQKIGVAGPSSTPVSDLRHALGPKYCPSGM